MRSILFAVGPWSWTALPIVWIIVVAFVLLWQRIDSRESEKHLSAADYVSTALVSLVAAAVIVLLVNRFGPLTIKAYGVMLLVGFAAGTWWTAHSADEDEMPLADVIDVALLALVGSIIGARVVYVVLEYDQFQSLGDIFNLWSGGLSFHGGLAGALLAVWPYIRYRGYGFLATVDQFAPGIALGYSFARIGCFLNGCCHGHATDVPWAVTFPSDGACVLPGQPVHPSQLYASAASLVIFLILIRLKPTFKQAGHLFVGYLMLYSVYRFLVEFTRAPVTAEPVSPGSWLTVAQAASIVIFVIGGAVMVVTWPGDGDGEENE